MIETTAAPANVALPVRREAVVMQRSRALSLPPAGMSRSDGAGWPRWWRMLIIAVCVLVLCSCRGVSSRPAVPPQQAIMPGVDPAAKALSATSLNGGEVRSRRTSAVAQMGPARSTPAGTSSAVGKMVSYDDGEEIVSGNDAASCPPPSRGYRSGLEPPALPPSAWTGEPQSMAEINGTALGGQRLPWAPPGIARPWPRDEYIGDGGDNGSVAIVKKNWQITGLEAEDTIAHYDTVDGRTIVEPSNHVEIYAPKFAAVRRVTMVNSYHQDLRLGSMHKPLGALVDRENQPANTVLQPLGAEGAIGEKRLIVQQQNNPPLAVNSALKAVDATARLKAYEDLSIIRIGQFEEAQKAVLAQRVQAAIAWTKDQGAQVILDSKMASVETGDRRAQATYTIGSNKKPRLRIVKVASTDAASPGEVVEFTLRYDNTGSEPIGNVTIVDNLTTRLEYVPDSATSSRKATFSTQDNDVDSLVLRWEISEPLQPGEGGTLRFKCRLR